MFVRTLFTSAAFFVCTEAATDAQKQQYSMFSTQMGIYGYDWDPYNITTEDGYTLTLMNVTKKTSAQTADASLNPLLMVPAMGSSPDAWLSVGA